MIEGVQNSTTCVGGPLCGKEVKGGMTKNWNIWFEDSVRKQAHAYARRSPTNPRFYFECSFDNKGRVKPKRLES